MLDWITILLFFAGLGIRGSDLNSRTTKVDAKVVHTALCICVWIRFMRYYAFVPKLGELSFGIKLAVNDFSGLDYGFHLFPSNLLFIFLLGRSVAPVQDPS